MPWYEFRCEAGHETEQLMPISSETRQIPCPQCAGVAVRRISAPNVRRVDSARAAAVEASAKTAYEPAVVNSLPASGNRRVQPVTTNPQHAKLPKP